MPLQVPETIVNVMLSINTAAMRRGAARKNFHRVDRSLISYYQQYNAAQRNLLHPSKNFTSTPLFLIKKLMHLLD